MLFADDSLLMCKVSEEDVAELIHCLTLCRNSSGHEVNKSKSSIVIGSQIDSDVIEQVKAVLNMDKEED